MTELQNTPETKETVDVVEPVEDELTELKNRAKLMGITHSPNIGVDTLRAKINEKLNESKAETKEPVIENDLAKQIREAKQLVRCIIVNNNPMKRDLPGEIFTVGNNFIGVIRRYIPYNLEGKPWHVERIMLDFLKDREYLSVSAPKDPRGGVPTERMVKEFTITELAPLTEEELKELATQQAARGSLEND